MIGSSFSYRFISARSCSAASGGNIDNAAFIPARAFPLSVRPSAHGPYLHPEEGAHHRANPNLSHRTDLTVATLVTSAHLNVAIRVIKKTRENPVMMIQNPYLSLSRSISSEVGAGVLPCISTEGPILSASFTAVVA